MALFWNEDLKDGIIRIEGMGAVNMYLVIGTERAALLDTGVGIGNLKEYVSTLTDLPVEVYLTHGHVDHAGGIYSFDHVHVNEKDITILNSMTDRKSRYDYAKLISEYYHYTGWTEDDLIEKREIELITIIPGEVIDLGGRTLTVIDFKGHTPGSVAFYDDLTQTVFLGDACNNSTFLFTPDSTDIETYLSVLKDFKANWMTRVRRLAICHDHDFVPLELIDNVIECCEKILSGTDDRDIFIHALANGNERWAAAGGPQRTDGKFGNVAYDIRRISANITR